MGRIRKPQNGKYGKTLKKYSAKVCLIPIRLHVLAHYVAAVKRTTIMKVLEEAAGPTLEHWAEILRDAELQREQETDKGATKELVHNGDCPPNCPYCNFMACHYHGKFTKRSKLCDCSLTQRHGGVKIQRVTNAT